MLEITNTEVFNLKRAVVSSGNAMRLEPEEVTEEAFERGLVRCKKLARLGNGNQNFRTGILVTFDLKYEQYITKQIQRYHFLQYVNSTSLMHRITKMDFDKCCNKYVSQMTKSQMKDLVTLYNKLQSADFESADWYEVLANYINYIQYICGQTNTEFKSKEDVLYDCYMRIISNCPMGAELTVHVSTNYEQLATIYKQRKNHKLKEDWGAFCKFIEELPYAKELIICEEREVSNE